MRRKRRRRRLKRAVHRLILLLSMSLLTINACFLVPKIIHCLQKNDREPVVQSEPVDLTGTEAEPGEVTSEAESWKTSPGTESEAALTEGEAGAGGEDSYWEMRPEEILENLTLEQKVLQLFVVTPEALTGYGTVTAAGDATKKSIEKHPVGGLIYFEKNLKDPEQVKAMLSNTIRYYAEEGYPMPFLAVDEEGGTVARIGRQAVFGVEPIGDMWDIGQQGDVGEAERVGKAIGTYLAALGFNLDFAPNADVLTNPDNRAIGRRSFGSDARLVADMALAEVKGLESCGVYGTLKHFPGHGATEGDTHIGYASTDKSLEALMEEELVPFAEGARADVPFIMVSHISVPTVTGDEIPCSLSRYMITDILRAEMGYDGIVITDAMNMGAISQRYTSAEAAVSALKAGVDMVLMPVDFESALDGVLKAVQIGELTEERIDESVKRILQVKYKKQQRSKKGFQTTGMVWNPFTVLLLRYSGRCHSHRTDR